MDRKWLGCYYWRLLWQIYPSNVDKEDFLFLASFPCERISDMRCFCHQKLIWIGLISENVSLRVISVVESFMLLSLIWTIHWFLWSITAIRGAYGFCFCQEWALHITINLHEPLNIMLKFSHFLFFCNINHNSFLLFLPPPPRHWLNFLLEASVRGDWSLLLSYRNPYHPSPLPLPPIPGVKYLLVTVEIQQTNNSLLGPWPGSTVTSV